MSNENLNNTVESQPTSEQIFAAGAEFIHHFEVKPDPIKQPEEFLKALDQFNPRFEGDRYLVRYELEKDQREWPEETKQVIMRAAEGMRMLEPETPLFGHYDVVIALGGARMANLDRARYAAEAVRRGQATFDRLIVSGSARKLRDDEKLVTDSYAPGAITELDLCDTAAKIVAEENPDLEVSAYPGGDEKAGTPVVLDNTFRYLRSRRLLPEDARVGIVTTQIYQAATSIDGMRIGQKHNVETMTAGNSSDPKIIEARKPSTYLAENIRTLRAATIAIQEAA